MDDIRVPRLEECGLTPIEAMKSMSGLELMRAIMEGRLPAPPMAGLMGFTMIEAEPGKAVFAGTPEFRHYNPGGAVHGGYAGTLLDSCMTCAVQTTLEAGWSCVTLEYKVNMVRPMTAETGLVRAEGTVIHPGRRTATAEGRMLDGEGRLLAHGTTTCLVFPV